MKNAWSNGPTGVKPADATVFIVDLLVRIGQKPQRQCSTVSALRSDTSRYAQVGRAPCRLRGGEPDPLHSFRRGAIRPSCRLQKHVEGMNAGPASAWALANPSTVSEPRERVSTCPIAEVITLLRHEESIRQCIVTQVLPLGSVLSDLVSAGGVQRNQT